MLLKMKLPILVFITTLALMSFVFLNPLKAQEGVIIMPPQLDQTAKKSQDVALLAGGCFWGIQGVFQHSKGVIKAVSGYAGGTAQDANYNAVSRGNTSHAESVKITYDPAQISYGEILHIYFSIAHDPTQLNRQGPDHGTQYRSAIFPQNEEQAKIAKAYISQLNKARSFDKAIVTKIENNKTFYPAESYHQDYLTNNPTQPYIVYNDLPKIENLKKFFPTKFQEQPRLVKQTGL